MEKKNVLLVFGGSSFEHDISIITALIIYKRAMASKQMLLPLYLSKNNEWFLFYGDKFDISLFKNFDETKNKYFKKAYFKNTNHIYLKNKLRERKIEVCSVINCCHGGVGEDGTLTAFFNMLNIPISTGCVLPQAIGMDKITSKFLFNGLKIPTINFVCFNKEDFYQNNKKTIKEIEKLEYPVIIKPAKLGSSIGIKVAKTREELIDGIKVAFEFDDRILVEKAIECFREFNIACMKYQGEIIVSEIDEPIKTDEILSFKDKYVGDNECSIGNKRGSKSGAFVYSKMKEVNLSNELKKIIKDYALLIYKKLELNGPVRLDFIMDKKNKIYINEINTVPGSLAYYFFVPSVFKTMNNFVDGLVEEAIDYDKNRSKLKKEFITKLI